MPTALVWLLDHPALLLVIVTPIAAAIYALIVKGDQKALVKLESLPLFHAHPQAAAILERGNKILMGLLKDAYDTALKDASAAPAFNEALAGKIAADVLKQLKAEFGVASVSDAAAVAGGEAGLIEHFEGTGKTFITAPSGRRIVAPA